MATVLHTRPTVIDFPQHLTLDGTTVTERKSILLAVRHIIAVTCYMNFSVTPSKCQDSTSS